MLPVEETMRAVEQALLAARFRICSEVELQAAIASLLQEEGWPFQREAILAPDSRIDFLVRGSLGIEVKIKGSLGDVHRQLLRYAPHVEGLLLVTSRVALTRLPSQIHGRPLRSLYLAQAVF